MHSCAWPQAGSILGRSRSEYIGSRLPGCQPSKARIMRAYLCGAKMHNRNLTPSPKVCSLSSGTRLWFLAWGCRRWVGSLLSWFHVQTCKESSCFQLYIIFLPLLTPADFQHTGSFGFSQVEGCPLTSVAPLGLVSFVSSLPSFLLPLTS